MSPLVVSLTPGHSLDDAIQAMQSEQADSIPVIDDNNQLVGVIGEEDIVAAMLTSNISERSVGDLMKSQIVTYPIATPGREVCEFLGRASVRQVFVVDSGQPCGVIRRINFVRWLSQANTNGETPERDLEASIVTAHP